MMNHKWNDDQCIYCGIKRKMKGWRLLMAVVNHPPWNCYKYGRSYAFSFNAGDWTFHRPDCVRKNLHNQKLNKDAEAATA